MDRSKARAALERDLKRHREHPTPAPRSGWVRAIRDAVGMSTAELAKRLGVNRSRIGQIEQAEVDGSLTLDTLARTAAALGCRVEYVLVPVQALEAVVQEQARAKAAQVIANIDHTMELEDQRPDATTLDERIDALAHQLVDKRGLWS